MKRMRPALLGPMISVAALVAAGFVLSTPASASGGAHLVQYGWWLISNYDPTATAPYAAPDAPDLHIAYGPNPDGLEKQDPNSPQNGPTEVSAVRYELATAVPQGTDPSIPVATLKFPVDATYSPAVSPQLSLLACPSLDPWSPAQGGNWQVRDTYNAGSNCAAGNPDANSTSFTFTITAGMMQTPTIIDLAIAPGFVPIGTCALPVVGGNCTPSASTPPQAPWSVDLAQPTDSSATAQPVASGGFGAGFSIPQENSLSVPTLNGSGLPASAFSGAQPAVPSPAPAAAKPGYQVPTGLTRGAPVAGTLSRGRLLAAVLLLLLFLGGLLLMATDVQQLLTPAGQVGGLGRFARPRSGPPLAI